MKWNRGRIVTHSSRSAVLMFQLDTCTVPSPCHRGRRCSYKGVCSQTQTFPPDSLQQVRGEIICFFSAWQDKNRNTNQPLKATWGHSPRTLVAVLSMTTQWAFSLAFSSYMVAGNSFWTGTLLLTACSISTRVTFWRQSRKRRFHWSVGWLHHNQVGP